MTDKLRRISPEEAKRLIDQGAVLVDVRDPDEHAREQIPGSVLMPLSAWDEGEFSGGPVIFHCRSGARTLGAADRLARKAAACEAFIVEGGLEAWKAAGLPVRTDRKQPLEMMRQVQIGAGAMAAVGTLLGLLVSPWFLALPLFVGGGLITAGLTGWCGLTHALARAPWNRGVYGPAPATAG